MAKYPYFLLFALFVNCFVWAANASTIPTAVQEILKEDFPQGKFRLDGVFQVANKLWLAFEPRAKVDLRHKIEEPEALTEESGVLSDELVTKAEVEVLYVNNDGDYLFSNGWIFTPIVDNTIKSLQFFDKQIQEQILRSKINQDFIVPKGFVLPRDLAISSGHLPIKLRDVELATDREKRYLDLLQEEVKDSNMEVISYDFNTGSFKLNVFSLEKERLESMGKKALGRDSDTGLAMYSIDDLSEDISLLSQIKQFDSGVFLVDYNRAVVYKLVAKEDSFDLIEWFKVDRGLGLQDFATSFDGSVSYLLTNKKSQLMIYDSKTKKQIKVVDLPANPGSIKSFSKDSRETDFVMVNSKGENKVVFLSSFDHRIIDELTVGSLPIDMAFSSDFLYVANKGDKTLSVIDWVSREIVNTVKLSVLPSKILISPDASRLFVLSGTDGKIEVIDLENYLQAKLIDLQPDILSPKDMAISPFEHFLIVGSADSNLIGVVDMLSLELVKKVDIKNRSNKLVVGSFTK